LVLWVLWDLRVSIGLWGFCVLGVLWGLWVLWVRKGSQGFARVLWVLWVLWVFSALWVPRLLCVL